MRWIICMLFHWKKHWTAEPMWGNYGTWDMYCHKCDRRWKAFDP